MKALMDYVCSEMKELERKAEKDGKLTMQEVQYLDTLAHTKKNLLKADEMWEDSEYSMAGDRSYRSYDRGGDSRMSYARGRGRNARRDSMGRYSRDGYSMDEGDFRMELQDLMQDAPNEQVKMKLQRLMSEI